MTYGYTDAYAGQFYESYPTPNLNNFLNITLTKSATMFVQSAVLTQDVQFPDVSFYQEGIDYRVMRLQTDTIILRVGQNLWIDDEFETNYLEAKKNGMRVGGYWFYDDRISPREQAELLLSALQGKTFELEIYIDWENTYGGEFKGLKNVVAMMELVEYANKIGLIRVKDVGIYTGYFWFRAYSNAIANASQYNYLKNKPLWLAWYTTNPLQVLIPAPWTKLTLWQWGTPSWYWGQKTKEIDMNWFNGTKVEFDLRYPILGETPMADLVKLTSTNNSNRSIRKPTAYPQTPHLMGLYIASLLSGMSITTDPANFYEYASDVLVSGIKRAMAKDKWWKVVVNGEEGWIAEIHMGEKLLNVELISDNPDPTPSEPHVVEVFIDGVLEFRKELL